MQSKMYRYGIIFLLSVVSMRSLRAGGGPGPVNPNMFLDRADLTAEDLLGRDEDLDDLIRDRMKALHEAGDELKEVIQKAKKMAQYAHDKEGADYYGELLTLIQTEGTMAVLHTERERVTMIMENVGEGAEFDFAMKQRNIIGAFSEAEANYIFGQLPEFGKEIFDKDFEFPDFTNTKLKEKKKSQPEEPTGEKEDIYYRKPKEDEEKKPIIPEGKGKKPEKVKVLPDESKQPELPKGKADGKLPVEAGTLIEGEGGKDPETPTGKGREHEEEAKIDAATKPDLPIGRQHDEI